MLKIIRIVLGYSIVAINAIFPPRKVKRSDEAQVKVAEYIESLQLYQFYLCPFCVKVRRHMTRLGISIETKDAKNNPEYRAELETGGGRIKVPCLKINEKNGVRWMYESSDINAYLTERCAELSA